MIIANAKYGIEIELKENRAYSLTVEANNCFADMVKNLYCQNKGEEGDFYLTENSKELKIEKYIDVIINPFAIDFNNRKITNKLYEKLKEVATEYDDYRAAIDTASVSFLDKITSQTPYEGITFDLQTDITGLLKLYHVQIDNPEGNLHESICEYIKVLSGLTETSVLCLVDIKRYLLPWEMEQVFMQATYSKVILFLLQSGNPYSLEDEVRYIVDKDLCLIF